MQWNKTYCRSRGIPATFARKGQVLYLVVPLLSITVGLPAVAGERSHGLSIFGPETLKYGPDEPFEYLNPDAPIGGRLRMPCGYFTKLTPLGLTGTAAPLTNMAFDTLGIKSWDDDEPFSVYGLVAQAFELADDKTSLTVYLRPEARFSDGAPLTADDVVFSYELIFDPNVNPAARLQYQNVDRIEKLDRHTVRFHFKHYTRDLPIWLTYLVIYPRHVYGVPGVDLANDFTEEPPVGSGPYEVESFTMGERIVYQRRDDYWARDLPWCKGFFNWKRIEYSIYHDDFSRMEAVKSGLLDYLAGLSPDVFAKLEGSYIDRGYLVKRQFPITRPSAMQGIAFNLRREKFQDRRVRQVIASLYDFEFINDNFHRGTQDRLTSYFLRQPHLRSRPGAATGEVREVLLGLAERHNRPEQGKIYVPQQAIAVGNYDPAKTPEGESIPISVRLQAAAQELDRLGWRYDPKLGVRRRGDQTLSFEIIDHDASGLYHFVETLRRVGIDARPANLSELEKRGRARNFRIDMTHGWYDGRYAPGRELARSFLSKEADTRGSSNLMGLKNPAIDEVLGVLMDTEDYEQLGVYARVFDRIMYANWYVVPKYWPRTDRGVYWNTMGRPEKYCSGLWLHYNVMWFWWEDPEKRAALDAAMAGGQPLEE